jgi:hypothetical protein
VSLWPYTDYVMDYGSIQYLKDSTGPLFQATMGYTPHLCGLGSLAQSLRGLRQQPLGSKLVQQGLLFARLHLRYALSTFDVHPCEHLKAHAAGMLKLSAATPPRDLSFTFLVLERVLDALGIDQLGSHDWFSLLALHSLDLQYEDGGWYPWREDRLVPTALHLLFLTRSQKPEPTDELPTYKPAPITTGPGQEPVSVAAALVEAKDGRHHRVVEVFWSLQWVGSEERVRLAEKALEGLSAEAQRGLLPSLEAIARKGPSRSKAFAERAIAAITGVAPTPGK